MALKTHNKGALHFDDDQSIAYELAARHTDLVHALKSGAIGFNDKSSQLRKCGESLQNIETAEIERNMRELTRLQVRYGDATAVVFDSTGSVVVTFDVKSLDDWKTLQASVKELERAKAWKKGDGKVIFSVYLMPKGASSVDRHTARLRAICAGTVKFAPNGKTTPELGRIRELEIAYLPPAYPPLGRRLEVRGVGDWLLRDILAALDRLEAEAIWIRDHGMVTTYDVDARKIADPLEMYIPVGADRNRQALNEVWMRIFVLATALREFGQVDLMNRFELGSANECKDLDPELFDFLPDWIVPDWDRYINAMVSLTHEIVPDTIVEPDALHADRQTSYQPSDQEADRLDAKLLDQPIEISVNVDGLGTVNTSEDGAGAKLTDTVVTGVVVNGKSEIVADFQFQAGVTHREIVARLYDIIRPSLSERPPGRYNTASFEVYIIPRTNVKLVILDAHAKQIGFFDYDPLARRANLHVTDKPKVVFDYPLSEDVFFAESLDLKDVARWSTRQILRTLDRLMEEHAFVDDHFGFEALATHDAVLQDQVQRHARVSDRIWTRIFALCEALRSRGRIHMLREPEVDFAVNCTDTDFDAHEGLPEWIRTGWEVRLEYYQRLLDTGGASAESSE